MPDPSVVLDCARSAASLSPAPRIPQALGGPDMGLRGLNSRPEPEVPVPEALRPRVGLDLVLSGSKGRKKLMNP